MTEAEQVQHFIKAARRLLGMRFVSGAAGQAGAIDCVHVPVVAAKKIGYLPPDFKLPHYPPSVDPAMWDEFFPALLDEVINPQPDTVREGDVVILYEHLAPGSPNQAYPRHCGILVRPAIPRMSDGSLAGWHWFGINFANPDAHVTEVPFHKKLWDRIYKVFRLKPPVMSNNGT